MLLDVLFLDVLLLLVNGIRVVVVAEEGVVAVVVVVVEVEVVEVVAAPGESPLQ